MAALDYLRRAGLTVETVADKLRVSPVELITDDIRQFVRKHRAELLVELSTANDSTTPKDEQQASTPPPHTLTAATASPEWRQARDLYINHLMGCRACYAPTGRYCPTGADLRQHYGNTPMEG